MLRSLGCLQPTPKAIRDHDFGTTSGELYQFVRIGPNVQTFEHVIGSAKSRIKNPDARETPFASSFPQSLHHHRTLQAHGTRGTPPHQEMIV